MEPPTIPYAFCLLLGISLALALHASGAAADQREIVISPSPTGAPVIGPALETAPPGAVVRLKPGLYREYVTITRTASLVGEEGAVIDPAEPLVASWESAAGGLGKGVYRAAVGRRPYALFIDGKSVAQLNDERPEPADEAGPWFWKRVIVSGPQDAGLGIIRGLWMYREDEHAVYMHLEGDESPASRACSVLWTSTAAVTIRDAREARLQGLEIRHGYNGVVIAGTSDHCSILGCRVSLWEKDGILLKDAAAGCLIERNEVFRAGYEDVDVFVLSPQTYDQVWRVHKDAGMWDRVGILVWGAGSGNRIHANRVYDVFDGIDVHTPEGYWYLDRVDANPMQNTGTEVWDNTIEDIRDSGIELGGSVRDVKVHHNFLRNTLGGIRYKSPRFGPIYIYRNVLVDNQHNFWYSMDDSPAEGYVYHNTVIGGDAFLRFGGWKVDKLIGAQNWHYLNNLSLALQGFYHPRGSSPLPIQFLADYNVSINGGQPYPDNPYRDTHSRYVESVDLQPGLPPKPAPGSPAIDAGLDLSTYLHGHPLPGCEPGYFKGSAPDAGAYEVQ
jgi:hypothetical protein